MTPMEELIIAAGEACKLLNDIAIGQVIVSRSDAARIRDRLELARVNVQPPLMKDMTGAFQVTESVSSTGLFVVSRCTGYTDGTPIWSHNLAGCSLDLWPWHQWATVEAAERAILDHGKWANETVTVVRDGGREIVAAAPGATFPQKVTGALTFVDAVTIGTFSVTPENWFVGGKRPIEPFGWKIDQWRNRAPGGPSEWMPALPPISTDRFKTYWEAIEHLMQEQPGAHVLTTSVEMFDQWSRKGYEVGKPSEATTLSGGSIEWVDTVEEATCDVSPDFDDPARLWAISVCTDGWTYEPTMFATYWKAVEHVHNIASKQRRQIKLLRPTEAKIEAWAKRGFVIESPVVSEPTPFAIGEKRPVSLGEGLYAVEEWTSTGWERTIDGLQWHEVETRLYGPFPSSTPVGLCEIRPAEREGEFDVFMMTSTGWRKIGGGLTKRTAEGVVEARYRDPEGHGRPAPAAATVPLSKRLTDIREKLHSIHAITVQGAVSEGRFEAIHALVLEALAI